MKIAVTAVSMILLAGCTWSRQDRGDDHHQTPGETAGRAAYDIQKNAKKAAKEAAKEIKSFGRDAREGFQEEKHKDIERKKDREREQGGPQDTR